LKFKSSKITKFSFKERLYHSSGATNNKNDASPEDLDPRTTMLGYYLAGLIEGDGSIIVPKTIRNQKGKLFY
jgi:hypothetical protein